MPLSKVDKLRLIKLEKLTVSLVSTKITPGDQYSGFWPRVTLSLEGVTRTFPLTKWTLVSGVYNGSQVEKAASRRIILDTACRMVGGILKAEKEKSRTKASVDFLVLEIENRFRHAVNKALKRKDAKERFEKAQNRAKIAQLKNRLQSHFKIIITQYGIDVNDIKPSEIGAIWDTVVKETTVSQVHDS